MKIRQAKKINRRVNQWLDAMLGGQPWRCLAWNRNTMAARQRRLIRYVRHDQ